MFSRCVVRELDARFGSVAEAVKALLDVLGDTAEALALGPLPIRAASPRGSSSSDGATTTQAPTP